MKRLLSALTALLLLLFLTGTGTGETAEEEPVARLRNGGSFVYVVREDGSILGWGDNRKGQLGTSPAKLLLKPRPAADGMDGKDLLDIQCGYSYRFW